MPIDSDSLSLLDLDSGRFSKKRSEAWVHVFVLFSSIMLKHLSASIKTPKATITHKTFQHCLVHLYAFVGQPFSAFL